MGERPNVAVMGGTALSADLVGRDVELAEMREALGAAAGGEGRVVFLVGEAGIGKSRLAEAVAADAADLGVAVLRGRATQGSTPPAYRPLAEALSSVLRTGTGPAARDLGPFRATLARLVPDWREDDRGVVEDSQVALAEAVLRFLRATAKDRGALVVLEDLQWADPETLTIVEYVTDNLASERVLCVVTVRDGERSRGTELVRLIEARRAARVLHLAPLEEPQVGAMVASCLRSPVADEVVTLADRADGVPFMVEELLATAISSGTLVREAGSWRVVKRPDAVIPPTFVESVRRRVDGLGVSCRTVLVAAAVLGRRFDWSLLPATTGLDEREVLRALHHAVDTQMVSFDGEAGSFGFRHALSRDAVLAGLFPPELAALSRRAVAAVEAAHPALEEGWGELAADLAANAGDRRRAATLLGQVAHRAVRQGALASAEATLDRARTLLSGGDAVRLDVNESLLEVLSLAGKRERAVEVASSLLSQLGTDAASVRRRAEVHLRLARAAVASTKWDEAQRHLQRARQEASVLPDDDLRARVDLVRAQTAIVRDPSEAAGLARAALETATRVGLPEVACEALEVLGRTQRTRDINTAEGSFGRALALAEASGLTLWRARALQELGAIDMLRGRPVDRLEEARELALTLGALPTAAVVDVQVAAALVLSDEPEAGAAAAQRSAELGRRYHFDQTVAAAVALEAYAHARRRRRGELQRCIDEARALAAGVPDIEVKTSTAAAVMALVDEDRITARRHLCAGIEAARHRADYSFVPAVGLLALLRQLDGPHDDAPQITIPRQSAHFLVEAFLRYADAVAAGRTGNAAEAARLMGEADRILERHQWFAHLGRRLVAEAAITNGWGEPVEWLRAALAFFDQTGDDAIVSACRSLLRRAGAPVPRRRDTTGVPAELRAQGVTARELEVLQLLGLGLSNQHIGARLYLSPRTVERHVANLTMKTGATRRSELVAYAARTLGANSATT